MYADKHLPQHLMQSKRLEPLLDKRIQWDDAVGDLTRAQQLIKERGLALDTWLEEKR